MCQAAVLLTSLRNTQQDVRIEAIDINGDVSNRTFTLSEEPTEASR